MQRPPALSVVVEFFPNRPDEHPRAVALDSGTTLADLIDQLSLPANAEAVLVNGRYERPQYLLKSGDHVRIVRTLPGGG